MKSFRSTFIFAAIVAAVVFFAAHEFKKGEVEEVAKLTKDNIFHDLKAEHVQELSYIASGIDSFSISRENNHWKMLTPIADDADDDAVDSLLRNILSKAIEKLDVEAQAIDSAKYGFSSPQAEFKLKLIGGTVRKAVIGSVKTYDQGFYIRLDDKADIYVSDKSWDSIISRTADELRSKKIKFDDGEPVRIKLLSKLDKKPTDVEFIKNPEGWVYQKNHNLKLQNSNVSDLYIALKNIRAEGILENKKDPSDLKKHSLQKPNVVFEVDIEGSDKKVQKISVMFAVPKTGEAAMMATANIPIYRVSTSKVEGLVKSLNDFRDKTFPFTFDDKLAKQAEIKKKNSAEILSLAKNGEEWTNLGKPLKKVDQDSINSLLSGLKLLRVQEFYSPKQKKVQSGSQVTIKGSKGETIFSLLVGGAQKSTDNVEIYLAKTNLSEEVLGVPKSSIDDLLDKDLVLEKPK